MLHLSPGIHLGRLLAATVNNGGKLGEEGLYFTLRLPSSAAGEPSRGGNFGPFGLSAVKQKKTAAKLLNERRHPARKRALPSYVRSAAGV